MNKDHAVGFGIGLLTGAVIGGVIALLYAPQSGKETRALLKNKAMETRDNIQDFATDTVENVKDGVSEVSRKGHAAVQALRN